MVTAYLFAGTPTSLLPSSANATTDGVVLSPSAFSMTFAVLPSITATQEFVVPRSIPMMEEKGLPWRRKVLTVFYFFKSELNILLILFFYVQ